MVGSSTAKNPAENHTVAASAERAESGFSLCLFLFAACIVLAEFILKIALPSPAWRPSALSFCRPVQCVWFLHACRYMEKTTFYRGRNRENRAAGF